MYRVFFGFSQGLSRPVMVEEGYYQSLLDHVADIERKLHIEREQCMNNPVRWTRTTYENVSDGALCRAAIQHNEWVRDVYWYLGKGEDGNETITPEMAQEFWHALCFIRVPVDRWTAEYYEDRMTHQFRVMTKGEHDGVSFDHDVLTVEQAAQIILLFSEYLDMHNVGLGLPRGYDFLSPSDDLIWCPAHGDHVYYTDSCDETETCKYDGECSIRDLQEDVE